MMGPLEFAAEFGGTFLTMLVGLSAIAFDFGSGSPMLRWVPDPALRRLITGTVFAGTGTLVVYSAIGRRSGGHMNPSMTLAFFRLRKMTTPSALGYVASQVAGALCAALVVRAVWSDRALSVHVGATLPGTGGPVAAFGAELVITFLLVTLVLNFVDRPVLMPFTAITAGVFAAFLVLVEAPVSGTSMNPARSVAPAVASVTFRWLWIYLIAPPLGALLAVAVYRRTRGNVKCGKLAHGEPCRFLDCQYTPRARRVPGMAPMPASERSDR